MPPRLVGKVKENPSRPVSAIYLGSGANVFASSHSPRPSLSSSPLSLANGTPPEPPELPEPPSPGSSISSTHSGLPSPPATNSTGSGSTGDPGSIALRQPRPRSFASDSSASTSTSSSGNTHKTMFDTARSGSRLMQAHDDFDDDDNDNDNEDETARLSENLLALQRVKSLTQRNRMAIDKLTRLGSPSPSHASSSSSSRLRQVRPLPQPPPRDQGLSGSETERESTTSSSRRPVTPPNNNNASSPYSRLRHISAPSSPNKARLLNAASTSGSNSSNSPSSRRRKRASMATMTALRMTGHDDDDDDDDAGGDSRFATATDTARERDITRDITQSALAAVASSRRSPLGTRRRGALPREFREDMSINSATADGTSTSSDARTRGSEESSDKRKSGRLSIEPVTPYRGSITNGVGRSSTVREVRRSGTSVSRWGSDDYRTLAHVGPSTGEKRERRQSTRGGSAESALGLWSPGGRTLLSEGLRAAGLSRKRDDNAVGGMGTTTANGHRGGDVFRDKRVDWSPHHADGVEGRRPPVDNRERERERLPRAATSMADYRYLDKREDPQNERERALRNHRSTYSLATTRDHRDLARQDRDLSMTRRDRGLSLTRTERDQLDLDRAGSSLSRYNNSPVPLLPSGSTIIPATATPHHVQERYTSASPFGTRRTSVQTPAPGANGSGDHNRIMLDSLSMFESTLLKLPPTNPSGPELLKHAQNVVYTSERLNAMLRQGTSRALEEQINAEVEGVDTPNGRDMLDIWRVIGGEYREGLRASDELVRALTGFLLDVGQSMRKLGSSSSVGDYGSPSVHSRSVSLEDENLRHQQIRDGQEAPLSISSGRRSVESRRSWEPALREREETLKRLAGGTRADSALAHSRASPALLAVRQRDRNPYETPSPVPVHGNRGLAPPASGGGASGSMRRLYTPRDERDRQNDEAAQVSFDGANMAPSDSQKTLQGNDYDPSPTPASRTGRDRSRTLPPLALPKPLPSLPSENTLRRHATTTAKSVTPADKASSMRDRDRRKVSVTSITTVRGSGPSFPGLTSPRTATTVMTPHTVSNSPQQTAFPLHRTDSSKSNRSTVTFSRPSAVSVSAALSGIQQQALDEERKRTISSEGQQTGSVPKTPAAAPLDKALSGSETERETRRKTLGSRTMRMSLDESGVGAGAGAGSIGPSTSSGAMKTFTAHAADRSAVSTILPQGRRERRRTVTDIWPKG